YGSPAQVIQSASPISWTRNGTGKVGLSGRSAIRPSQRRGRPAGGPGARAAGRAPAAAARAAAAAPPRRPGPRRAPAPPARRRGGEVGGEGAGGVAGGGRAPLGAERPARPGAERRAGDDRSGVGQVGLGPADRLERRQGGVAELTSVAIGDGRVADEAFARA